MNINQYTPNIAYADSISNSMLYIQKMLREMGFSSNIYMGATYTDLNFKHNLYHIDEYEEDEQNLLIYHFSIKDPHHKKIMGFKDKKVLIYHNITPSHFFKKEPHLQELCDIGREQLKNASSYFIASLADSSYNAKELYAYGYKNVKVLTLLVDMQKQESTKATQNIIQKYANSYNILFVGRVVQNKCQHQLVELLYMLKNRVENVKLFLVGGVSQAPYFEYIKTYVKNLSLQDDVIITNKVSDEDLKAYYEAADLYISLSEHEGFGMPLIEAMKYDIPTLAYDAGGVSSTIPSIGLLEKKSANFVMQKVEEILNNPYKRVELIKAQKEHLQQFSHEHLFYSFSAFLNELLNMPSLFGNEDLSSSFLLARLKPCFHLEVSTSSIIGEDKSSLPLSLGNEVLTSSSLLEAGIHSRPYSEDKSSLPLAKTTKNIRIEGAFDSSYSLAIVNSKIAAALQKYTPYDVSLYSTEGGGDFTPNLGNLDEATCTLYNKAPQNIDITIRNTYPPRTNAMRGYHKIIGVYGWEESRFLPQHVKLFNQRLTLVFTMSNYVSKVLSSSGVHVPLVTTAIVVDHILEAPSKSPNFTLPSGFKLLHVSSAFPRKGVDVLLRAFDALEHTFSLTIKTFPNPHNRVLEQLQSADFKLVKSYEEGVDLYKKEQKEILLINKELPQCEMRYLYENSNLLVAPTRGEGFGLPQAEAMLLNLSVLTTAYGGQSDFCTDERAYLIDFYFDYAKTHMNLMRSYWLEPKLDSLIERIKHVASLPKEQILQKTQAAKKHVEQNYSSKAVALKIQDALESYAMPKQHVNIAVQSTYNTKCGIAQYTTYLISKFKSQPLIFAPYSGEKLQEDCINTIRCWQQGLATQDMLELKNELLQKNITHFIIQYNFGFYTLKLLEDLIYFCRANNIKTYLFLHSTAPIKEKNISLSSIKESLKLPTQIFVHTLRDLNYLKDLGTYENTQLFFHGIDTKYQTKQKQSKNKRATICNFGFSLPQKGILELIEAVEILHVQGIEADLILLNALHPDPSSREYNNKIKDKIASSSIREHVYQNNSFLKEEPLMLQLQNSDIVVYPYQNTQESSSAAVRFGIMAQKPVVVTPLDIFEDIQDIAIFSEGITPSDIAKTLRDVLDGNLLFDLKKHQQWMELHSWENVSTNLYNYIISNIGK